MVRLHSIGVNSLAVVTRDASNPSTGLFAKQQVSGTERFERPSGLLESLILPLDETPMSAILDLNQGLPRYQHDTLPTELMADYFKFIFIGN